MPQVVSVRIRSGRGRRVQLWVPILPLLLILSPVLLLVLALTAVACLVWRVNPLQALHASWRLLCALRGTLIEVDQRDAVVLVNIR